jgi:hypothetical protein
MSQKSIKKDIIKTINKSKIEDVIYEPRYIDGYKFKNSVLIGSTITIRTSLKK